MQPVQPAQFVQRVQSEQSVQSVQFVQFVQFMQSVSVPSDSRAAVSLPQYSTDARLPLSSVIQVAMVLVLFVFFAWSQSARGVDQSSRAPVEITR